MSSLKWDGRSIDGRSSSGGYFELRGIIDGHLDLEPAQIEL